MALLVSGGRGNMRPWGAAWSTVAKLKKKKFFLSNDLVSLTDKSKRNSGYEMLYRFIQQPIRIKDLLCRPCS